MILESLAKLTIKPSDALMREVIKGGDEAFLKAVELNL